MKIRSVYDKTFAPYGKVLEGYDTSELAAAMKEIPMPEAGTAYEMSIPALESVGIYGELQNNAYGGMPVQMGMCWGYNTKLNCLEYHRDSEINIGEGDFILLLAREDDIENGVLDTKKVKAFRAPAGVPVEVYATTLHYAPCHVREGEGFRVAIVLPRGTNGAKPAVKVKNGEDKYLWACNKWLLAHSESLEAADGAADALKGENIDIAKDILKLK